MNPQATKIYNILKDGNWHCPREWFFADGHTKRITDINRFVEKDGLKVESKVCDCGRHSSRVFKRKLVKVNEYIQNTEKRVEWDNPRNISSSGQMLLTLR